MAKREKRPSWFRIFLHQRPLIEAVPDHVVGKALKAALLYFDTGEERELDELSLAVYSTFKPYVEESFRDYERDLENGKRGGRPKKPPVTPGKGGVPTPTQAEADTDTETDTDTEAEKEREKETTGVLLRRQSRPRPHSLGSITIFFFLMRNMRSCRRSSRGIMGNGLTG